MSPLVHRIGSGLCLALGMGNLAWIDFVLIPRYLNDSGTPVPEFGQVADAPADVARAPEVADAPAQVAEVAEAPAQVADAPAEAGDAPAEVADVPAPVADAPAEAVDAPAEVADAPLAGEPKLAKLAAEDTPEPIRVPGLNVQVSSEEAAETESKANAAGEKDSPDPRSEPVEPPQKGSPSPGPNAYAEAEEFRLSARGEDRASFQKWRVRFRHGESSLSAVARDTLGRVARAHQASRGRLLLEGHSDPTGPKPFNLDLSRARAEAVFAWLVGAGVPESAIVIEAYGEDGPRPSGTAPSSYRARRRVEILLEKR